MSHNLKPELVERIAELTRAGATTREIKAATGAHTVTVMRHQRLLGLTEILCGCGLPIKHRGWCPERYARSVKRQAFMARWHGKAPGATDDDVFVGTP